MLEEKATLMVRHLPPELTIAEQEELLKHFSATRVRCMGREGQLKHCAFAAYSDPSAAKKALTRLHQLEVLGSVLSVEFSRRQFEKYHPSVIDSVKKQESDKDKEAQEKVEAKINEDIEDKKKITERVNQIDGKWGLVYPMNPRLQYMYPPPTVTILTNIANALAASPKFYVQVLHLMNKLNLPPPFGALTPTPPVEEGVEVDKTVPTTDAAETSTEESELESDDGTEKRQIDRPAVKRLRPQSKKINKKAKLQQIINPIVAPTKSRSNVVEPSEVFEQSQTGSRFRNIRLCIPGDGPSVAPTASQMTFSGTVAPHFETTLRSGLGRDTVPPAGGISVPPPAISLPSAGYVEASMNIQPPLPPPMLSGQPHPPLPPHALPPVSQQAADLLELVEHQSENAPQSGFGKIEPTVKPPEVTEEPEGEEEWGEGEFISDRRLRRNRLSSREMKEMKVFQNYSAGEPSSRLYVKNLAKSTTEKDLHYIFGRYVDWQREDHKMMFDIRLMKEGRMKGQAFITFPTDVDMQPVVKDTNAFLLHDKPMVVVFARSAKPKDS